MAIRPRRLRQARRPTRQRTERPRPRRAARLRRTARWRAVRAPAGDMLRRVRRVRRRGRRSAGGRCAWRGRGGAGRRGRQVGVAGVAPGGAAPAGGVAGAAPGEPRWAAAADRGGSARRAGEPEARRRPGGWTGSRWAGCRAGLQTPERHGCHEDSGDRSAVRRRAASRGAMAGHIEDPAPLRRVHAQGVVGVRAGRAGERNRNELGSSAAGRRLRSIPRVDRVVATRRLAPARTRRGALSVHLHGRTLIAPEPRGDRRRSPPVPGGGASPRRRAEGRNDPRAPRGRPLAGCPSAASRRAKGGGE